MDKSKILEAVKERVSGRIKNLEDLITGIRASNNDTKSAMGDKYETGREMLQQEINNLQQQLKEALNQQALIQKITPGISSKVQNGALVKTDKGLFYISASVGEIVHDGRKIMTVSSESPLIKAMAGKKAGENFTVNNVSQVLENIW
ncbi:hypothetical protein [Chryseobacterium gossypii]|uniref:hypothetical protein n=1 Tax=Chryseobacterium gossypii TaxID=3231602 RepID=UPI0035244237